MANKEQLAILMQGVEVWNRWREEKPGIEAHLHQTELSGLDLRKADLSGALLSWTNVIESNLNGADLSDTNLVGTNFVGTSLNGANLENAWLHQTLFIDVDLSDARGLENVDHYGRSYLDIHTIYRSGGNIPEVFLRGAGVPDVFIEYMRSLVGKAIEYYSCFISYSSKDQALAERIHNDLQSNGVRCWFAPHDLRIGDKMRPSIDEAIRVHDKLLLILSEHSVGSDWVEHEVEAAIEQERQQGKLVLSPVRIDEAVMDARSGWAAHIKRTRHIGDFQGWKNHDAYQEAFQRLLRDLKTDKKAPEPAAVFSEVKPGLTGLVQDEERIRLKNILVNHFNDSELRELYFELSVDYENVPGETKADKARELVTHFERHRPGGAATLAEYVRGKRPSAFN